MDDDILIGEGAVNGVQERGPERLKRLDQLERQALSAP